MIKSLFSIIVGSEMKVALMLLGDVDSDIMGELKDRVRGIFRCPVETKEHPNDIAYAYNAQRKQYLSSKFIAILSKVGREKNEIIAGITDVDLYMPRLNFVFGEADVLSRTAIVSLCRLRQEYYGLPPDKDLLLTRATKEVVHELGHTFGLRHCSNSKCVMRFSNSLADTDWKEVNFCPHCCPSMEFLL